MNTYNEYGARSAVQALQLLNMAHKFHVADGTPPITLHDAP